MAKFNELFREIPIEDLFPSPTNPRKTFRENSLQDLAESIKANGVLMPVLVRPVEDKFEIVAGERRYRASKLAGKALVPCRVEHLADDQVLEIQVIENLQREDVNPMEEAQGYLALMEKNKVTVEDIAHKVAKSIQYVTTRLKFNELIPAIQEMFLNDQIQISHAVELCRLTPADQKECLEILQQRDFNSETVYIKTPAQLKGFIRKNISLNLKEAPFSKDDATLYPLAGTCKTCPKRSGFNKTLFNDVEEKDRCFDKSCYWKKMDAFLVRKQEELKNSGLKFKLISDKYYLEKEEKKKFPSIISTDQYVNIKNSYKSKAKCEFTIQGLIVAGEDIGKVIDICPNKACAQHNYVSRSSSSKPDDPIEKIKHRMARARELDEEKIQVKIADQLAGLNLYNKEEFHGAPLNDTETKALVYLVLDGLGFHDRDKLGKALKWNTGHHGYDGGKDWYKRIETATDEEIAYIVRMAIRAKYLHCLPSYTGATIIREIARDHNIDLEDISAEQIQIREKREKRMNEQLNALMVEKKNATAKRDPGIKKKINERSASKSISSLFADPDKLNKNLKNSAGNQFIEEDKQ